MAALASLATPMAYADTNVALGGNVNLVGTGFGDNAGWAWGNPSLMALPLTVTDGQVLQTGQQWNEGTVFWSGSTLDTSDIVTSTLGHGMGTASISFSEVAARAFQVHASGGDGHYALSEFQVRGNTATVPEPGAMALMLAGLALVGAQARRRKAN